MIYICWVCCHRYKPFLVAEVQLNEPGSQNGDGVDPVEADKASAFKLAGFLGEKNERGQKLSMTTPVFNKSKQGVMQFYIGEGYKVNCFHLLENLCMTLFGAQGTEILHAHVCIVMVS